MILWSFGWIIFCLQLGFSQMFGRKTNLPMLVYMSMFLLCHRWSATTNLSYTFPILETSSRPPRAVLLVYMLYLCCSMPKPCNSRCKSGSNSWEVLIIFVLQQLDGMNVKQKHIQTSQKVEHTLRIHDYPEISWGWDWIPKYHSREGFGFLRTWVFVRVWS